MSNSFLFFNFYCCRYRLSTTFVAGTFENVEQESFRILDLLPRTQIHYRKVRI